MFLKIRYKISHLILFCGLLLFFAACKNDKCLKSSGEITSEFRSLESFKSIDIYDSFNVYLKSDTVCKIEIEAGSNLISNIETSIIDGVLTIKDLNKCSFLKGYADKNLYISVDTLVLVTIYDASNLYTQDTLNVENIRILFQSDIGTCNMTVNALSLNFGVWYGSGDYTIKGCAQSANINANELSFIYADELESNSCYVYSKSMGDCYVKASESLSVDINDVGNIYYSGDPPNVKILSNTGSGKLIKK